MLSQNLENALKKALDIAKDHHHEYATYEHLLLALLNDKDINKFFYIKSISIEILSTNLIEYLQYHLADLVNLQITEAKPTAGFQRIIQRAALHGQANGDSTIQTWHVLAEFFFENNTYAYECLEDTGITRQDIIQAFQNKNLNQISIMDKPNSRYKKSKNIDFDQIEENLNRLLKESENLEQNIHFEQDPDNQINNETENEENAKIIEKYCINLNKKAENNEIDDLIGREKETQRVIEILSRRKKNNTILVGDAGVGKTAIAENLAIKIINKEVPAMLENSIIYSLDIGSLIAGTKFRGEFEERIKHILSWIKAHDNILLFIDEIHTIIGAGSTIAGGLDVSNLIKPALSNGELRCIGATTYDEYKKYFEKDQALIRRFQKITVEEPSDEDCLAILQGTKKYYEDYHNVKYSDSALSAAIKLSKRYINDKNLPDKAIDLIDEVGARLNNKSKKKSLIITQQDIETLISKILNTPINNNLEGKEQIFLLEQNLQKVIFGQNKAIHDLASSIKLSAAGLVKENRPVGFYLFSGNSGVGKTELAKQLAKLCNMHLLKLDMSEFSEKNSISKLIGSAPGYVGFEKGGMLTNEIDKYPYSVILFDEIEKAHNEIYNILLQIMDDGRIKDSNGKNIKFNNSIIILTTNITPKEKQSKIGFAASKPNKAKNTINNDEKQLDFSPINNYFTIELRNRLDKIIYFNPITKDIVLQIVEKNLTELAAQLADKKVKMNITKEAKNYIATEFYDQEKGARVFDHAIDEHIKQEIANEILFGRLSQGGAVLIDLDKQNKKLIFKFNSLKVKKKSKDNIKA